jgi:hypothetical protein
MVVKQVSVGKKRPAAKATRGSPERSTTAFRTEGADPALLQVPVVTLPEAERALVEDHYSRADVVLEYGSGGSTLIAASGKHRLILSVESDERWAKNLAAVLKRDYPAARAHVHWVDVGQTKAWGRPAGDGGWRHYHRYPLSVWDRPDFLPPDVVLIDGRFRVACFMATLLRIARKTTVLWDDYVSRPPYARIERFAKPVEIVGRMAHFEIKPMDLPRENLTEVIGWFNDPN